jgi:hypothetical protein
MDNTKLIDMVTLKRIQAARKAMDQANSDWGKDYWSEVVEKLISSCDSVSAVDVVH